VAELRAPPGYDERGRFLLDLAAALELMKRSKISSYPPELRQWLEAELVRRGFSGYEQLAADLVARSKEVGSLVETSKSSLHRYGTNLERKLSAIRASTEAASLIAKSAPDDADLRSAAVISLIQTEVFDVLVALQDSETENDPMKRAKLLSTVAKNVATLSRASVNQKRHEMETRGKAQAAADRAAKIGKKGGLSAGAVDEIRREILGIAA
jgi:uncharacterized protein DUF3486